MLPTGTEIRPANYTDYEQLKSSFQGIDKLLFISSQPDPKMPRDEQHHNVVNASKEAGASFVAYTSAPKLFYILVSTSLTWVQKCTKIEFLN